MKNIRCLILTFVLICSTLYSSLAQAYNKPEKLCVGLYYNTNARANMKINAEKGLSLGYYSQGTEFTKLIEVNDNEPLIVRKDTYFTKSGSNNVEETSQQNAMWGPYHLRYYSNLDINSAKKKISELRAKNIDAFIACIGLTINVWSGNYVSKNQAEEAKANSSIYCEVAQVSDKRIQVLRGDNFKTLFLFGHTELGLGVKAGANCSDSELLKITTKAVTTYRGGLDFKRLDGGNLTVANVVNLEQYLYRVVANEMESTSPLEALKAQAVCARNYAVRNLKKHTKKYGFDLCNDVCCQSYLGLQSENERCIKAVKNTEGELLMYHGEPIMSCYASVIGPKTEDVKNVWGNSLPYLVSVDNSYEDTKNAVNGIWSNKLTKQRATEIMKNNGSNIGNVNSIRALEYSPAGSVIKLEVSGTNGSKIFERERARTIFSAVTLSQMYTVTNFDNDTFVFNGHGWGHGLGMSQAGAVDMAKNNFDYKAILTHYYSGTYLAH